MKKADYVNLWRWMCMLYACEVIQNARPQLATTMIDETVKVIEVGIDESAMLPCFQRATGSFLLEWKRRDLPDSIFILLTPKVNAPHIDSRYTGRLDVAEDGVSLSIDAVKVDDAGYYQCIVQPLTNWDRSSNFTWINLVIRSPPVFASTSPPRINSVVGSTVILFCITSLPTLNEITWLKEGQPLVLENRFQFTDDSLTISHLVSRDGGAYTCQAENVMGTSEYTLLLIIQGAPYIVNPPQNITVREHMPAHFQCGWEASPDNVTVYWYYDKEPVQSLAKFGLYADILEDGSLFIGDTQKAFSGWFMCSPSNGLGVPPSKKAFLSVQYSASPLPMQSEVVAALGFPITLHCRADANPAISDVIWRKEGTILYPSTNERLSISKTGSLTITDTKSSDEGSYSCKPFNLLGSAGESAGTYLLVRDAPIFTSRPKAFYQRMPGDEVSIPCTASGSPSPSVTWRKVGGTLASARTTTLDGILRIVQLRKEDHGIYECIISNVITTLVTSTQLIIEQTTPHAPYNVTVVTTSKSAYISWQPAYDGGLSQSYTVWFRAYNIHDSQWTTLPLLPEDVTSATLYNLRPSTQYEFSIISSNELGKSMFSEVIVISTKNPDNIVVPTDTSGRTIVPRWSVLAPSPPHSLTINTTNSGLILQWKTPLQNFDLVILFTVEYRKNSNGHWAILIDNIPPLTRVVTLLDLEMQTSYDFRMFAFTPGSFSLPSNVVTGFTGDIPAYVINNEEGDNGLEGSVLAGIIAGLVFLILALILMILVVIIVRRRQQKKRELQEILGLPSYGQQEPRATATSPPSITLPFKKNYASLKAKFSPVRVRQPPKVSFQENASLKQRILHKDRHIRRSPRSLQFEQSSRPSTVDHSTIDIDTLHIRDLERGDNSNQTMLTSRPDAVLSTSEYALEVDVDDEVFVHPRQFSIIDQSRTSERSHVQHIVHSQTYLTVPNSVPNKPRNLFTASTPLTDITQSSFAPDNNISSVCLSSANNFPRCNGERYNEYDRHGDHNETMKQPAVVVEEVNSDVARKYCMLSNQRNNQYSGNRNYMYQSDYENSPGVFVLRGDNSNSFIRKERFSSPVSSDFYRREHIPVVPRQKTLSNLSLVRESSIDPPVVEVIPCNVYPPMTPSSVMEHSMLVPSRNEQYRRTAPFLKRRRRTQEIDVARHNNHFSLDRRKVRSVGDLRGSGDQWSYPRGIPNPRAYGLQNPTDYQTDQSAAEKDVGLHSYYRSRYAGNRPLNMACIAPLAQENDTLEISPNYSAVSSSTSGVGSMAPSINNASPRQLNPVGTSLLSPYSKQSASSGYGSRSTSYSMSVHGRNGSVVSTEKMASSSSSPDSTFDGPMTTSLEVVDSYPNYGDPFMDLQSDGYNDQNDLQYRRSGMNSKPHVHSDTIKTHAAPNAADDNQEEIWFARIKEEFNEFKRQQELFQRRKLVSSV